jgi:hypothetical protein
MLLEQLAPGLVAKFARALGRAHHVREETSSAATSG